MIKFLPPRLIELAKKLSQPVYVVGGFTRNFLINGYISEDIDICSALRLEQIKGALDECDFKVVTEIERTGTLIVYDGQRKYEFTTFRTEEYYGGEHTPYKTVFTDDIVKDAMRRDFKCNAVYYDIKTKNSLTRWVA